MNTKALIFTLVLTGLAACSSKSATTSADLQGDTANKNKTDFEYNVPENVWAVKGEHIIWVQPGKTIKSSVPVEPFGDLLRVEQVTTTLNKLSSEVEGRFIDQANSTDMQEFLKRGFSLIRSQKNFREAVKSYSTSKLDNLASKLFFIAISDRTVIDTQTTTLLKSLSAILSYEIASTLTNELASYCDVRTVKVPQSSEILEVKGSHYAISMMDRLIRRLEGQSLGVYNTFFDYVASLEAQHMTYAQASANESIRKKLESSFQTVRVVARPEYRPFADAYQDLSNFAKIFKGIGSGPEMTDEIAKNMSLLANLEHEFISGMFTHVRLYGASNTDPISAQNLRAQISEMQRLQLYVKDLLQNHTRFLSLPDGNGVASFNAMLTRFLQNNLYILQNSTQNKNFKFDFEPIRTAYVDVQKINSDNDILRKCIFNGDKN